MQKISQKYIKTITKQALQEDLRPSGDITTKFLKNRKKQVIAKIISDQRLLNFRTRKFLFKLKLEMEKK